MKKVFRPLLVLHGDRPLRERIRDAAGSEYHFHSLKDWDDLLDAIREAPPAAIVVADPFAGQNGSNGPAPALRTILREFPSIAVLAAMEVTPGRAKALQTLGKWGVVQIISLQHDDTPVTIAQRLRQARGRPLQALIEQVLPPETPGRARAIIDAATDIVAVGGHGRDLASNLGLSRRTLLRWCGRAGLPPPRKLLAWMRVLQAAALLDDPGRTVLSVAQICGYSSDSGLRRITQKFLSASPTDLREQGAFRLAGRAFVEELAKIPRA
jgi:AraC-like DNA-binding protein